MYLSGYAATHPLLFVSIGLFVLGTVLMVLCRRGSGPAIVVGFVAGMVLFVAGFAGSLTFAAYNGQQAHELRQAAKATYGITLTEDASFRLVEGHSPWVALRHEGNQSTEQKLHLIKVQDSNRWKLVRVGQPRVVKVDTQPELPKVKP
jgi:hypothetical protein